MDFVDLPIETSAQGLLEEFNAQMEAFIEGWTPELGEYETLLAQAIIYRLFLPLINLAATVPATIFDTWGREIVNLRKQEAESATVKSTWTMIDSQGYTVKAGTQVDVAKTGDERVGFVVAYDVAVPVGQTTTQPGEVILEAVEEGTEGNGLSGTGILVDALSYVAEGGVALEGESSGGADEEEDAAYLGRLAETMQTFIEGVVVARDVAIVVRNVAGIGRVTVIDNYNAETGKGEQEKTTTVVVTDDSGLEPTAEAIAAAEATLQAKREVNYLFFVRTASYSTIDVEGELHPQLGYEKAAIIANVEAALDELFNPLRAFEQPSGDTSSWVNVGKIRYQDVVTAINNAEGVDYVEGLKIGKNGGAKGTADLTLTGLAPLPKPGTYALT